MTFPAITSGSGNSGANTTSYVAAIASNLAAGDLIFLAVHKDGTGSITWPASPAWTSLSSGASSGASFGEFRYRRVTGTEGWGGAGNSITLTGANEGWAHAWARVTAAHDSTNPETATGTGATSTQPDCPSVTASWGAADSLVIGTYGWDGNTAHSAFPSGFGLAQVTSRWANSNGCGIALCAREEATAVGNPGQALLASSEEWRAFTAMIRPVEVVVGEPAPRVLVVPAPAVTRAAVW